MRQRPCREEAGTEFGAGIGYHGAQRLTIRGRETLAGTNEMVSVGDFALGVRPSEAAGPRAVMGASEAGR